MTSRDSWGASFTRSKASTPDVVDRWQHTVLALCGHRADASEHLNATLETEPGFLPALCLRGYARLFKGQIAQRPAARAIAAEARELASRRGATPRERHLIEALDAWARDDIRSARAHLEATIAACPTDLFALKLQHGLLFMAGDPWAMRRSLEQVHLPWCDEGLPGRGYYLGCLAFALGETGALEQAEARGRAAVEAEPLDAWGVHAVAHVMESTDRVAEGVRWLSKHRASYAQCAVFRGHVYWHEALFLCELGRHGDALGIYDAEVARPWCGDYRDMSNAVSLLWRLEADGVNVGERWQTLAAIAVEHARDHGSAFADAHYLLALARGSEAGDEALLTSMAAYVREGHEGDHAAVVREHGLSFCRALRTRERGTCSAEELDVLAASTLPLGGSTAQRDLFSLIAIDAALAANDHARATRRLHQRLEARPNNRWASVRLAALRKPEEA